MSITSYTQSTQLDQDIIQLPLWEYQELLDELGRTKEELALSEMKLANFAERLRREEITTQEQKAKLQKIRDLASNPNLSPSQKWTMWAIIETFEDEGHDLEQVSEINVQKVASKIGMSRHTAGDNIQTLAKTGAIVREERREPVMGRNGRKTWRRHVSVGLTLFSDSLDEIKPPQPRNQGGQRCQKCKSENLEIYKTVRCRDCGHQHSSKIATLGKKEQEEE